MKIQYVSDLHCDCNRSITSIPRNPEADVLIIAGDIGGNPSKVLLSKLSEEFKDTGVPVLYVLGNHCFYDSDIYQEVKKLKDVINTEEAKGINLHVLDSDSYEIRDQKTGNLVKFFGGTMWTPMENEERHFAISKAMNDYYLIKRGNDRFTITDAQIEHDYFLSWLFHEKMLKNQPDKKVIVTHHAPSLKSLDARYDDPGNPYRILNDAYVCELEEQFIKGNDLWIHGHVHTSFDYEHHGCRIVCNPHGYGKENPAFDMMKIVEI